MSQDAQWLSCGRLANAVWRGVMNGPGFAAVAVLSMAIGHRYLFDPARPATAILVPVAVIVALFILFLFAVLAWSGDFIADRLIARILLHPSPTNPLHQSLYLILSLSALAMVAIITGVVAPGAPTHLYHN